MSVSPTRPKYQVVRNYSLVFTISLKFLTKKLAQNLFE